MPRRVLRFFATGSDAAPIADPALVRRLYESKRLRVFVWLIVGYGFFYTCRLSLSVAKKPMLDAGVMSVEQMGIVGAVLLYVYAVGKFVNGFLSDHADIRRFMSTALLLSALVNLLFGAVSGFWMFAALWALNGWFQSIGSAPSVVSLCQWFSQRERGTRYGIWAGAHNIGEGLTFVGTALVVNALGWRAGFWVPGLVCVGVALLLFRNLADRPQTYGLPHVADYKNDYSAGKPTTVPVTSQQVFVLRHPLVWVLGLSSACMYACRYAINSWAVLYLQESKGYEIVEAASVMAAYPTFGFFGAVFSGFLSDRFFGSRRNVPTLLYGAILIGSLLLLRATPPGYLWLDAVALGAFGFAIGGLIVFLAGLTAIDVMPKGAAGAVKGIIGLFSYMGAATQDWVSGVLIERSKVMVGTKAHYDFESAFIFWIAAAVLSLLLALFAWHARARE